MHYISAPRIVGELVGRSGGIGGQRGGGSDVNILMYTLTQIFNSDQLTLQFYEFANS